MHKLKDWVIDYAHLLRGGAAMYFYRNPPRHYLDFILPHKAAVILLPGFLEKWGFMKNLGDYISRHGHPTYIVPKLGHNISDIPSGARIVRMVLVQALPQLGHHLPNVHASAQLIRHLLDKYDIEQAVFVAHSKGGLVGKYYLAHFNQDEKVRGMVAIATPFSGSALAKLIPHSSFQELTANNQIIQDLEKHREVNHRIISIYPQFDNHIWTPDASHLDGAENIQVNISGHHRVLFDKQAKALVLKCIGKLAD
jgi:triacylglycerol lipase